MLLQLDLDPALRAHLGVAFKRHLRQLKRDGVTPPPELAALGDLLIPPPPAPPEDAVTRARRLSAERSRRYQQRDGTRALAG
jgi:hypothetical protein